MKVLKIDEMAVFTRIDKSTDKDNVLTFLYHHNEDVNKNADKFNKVAFDVYLKDGNARRYAMTINHYRGGASITCDVTAFNGHVTRNGAEFDESSAEDLGTLKITFEGGDERKPVNVVMWEILSEFDSDYYDKINKKENGIEDVKYIKMYDGKTISKQKTQTQEKPQYVLTNNDIKTLLKNGVDDEDIEAIQACLDNNGVVFTDFSGKEIDAEQALKILGYTEFLSGLERSLFHHSCSRGIGVHKVNFNTSEWHDKIQSGENHPF